MKNIKWWTPRESWLVVLFLLGTIAIVVLAGVNKVEPMIQAGFVLLFALATGLVWQLGRIPMPHKRRGQVGTSRPRERR